MSAFRDDGVLVRLFADDACKRYAFEQFLVVFVLRSLGIPVRRSHCLSARSLPLRRDLPVSVELPALLVVLSRMQKLAVVTEAAESLRTSVSLLTDPKKRTKQRQ